MEHKFPRVVQLVLSKKIRLHLNGCKVIKTLAGNICLVNPVYGQGYYGTFGADGSFRPTSMCTSKQLDQLKDVEERGLDAVREIGRLTGTCCICGRELTDEQSIADGIGPICAGKIGGF